VIEKIPRKRNNIGPIKAENKGSAKPLLPKTKRELRIK